MSTDYANLYEGYWRRPDRFGSSSFADADEVARRVVLACGPSPVLDTGCGMGALVRALLTLGVDARGVDVAPVAVEACNALTPGRFGVGSLLALPFHDKAFETVVCTDCLEHLSEEDVPGALRELSRVARRNVFVTVSTVADRDRTWHLTIREREWWQARAFEAGLRMHPRAQAVVGYNSLEQEGASVTLVLEKAPEEALRQWPLEALAAGKQLHMDMLREPGRRADAHVARYQFAAGFVRPGDAVLDVACGLGYGAAILAANSGVRGVVGVDVDESCVRYARGNYGREGVEFRAGDAGDLSFVADESVDLISCFETLEHVAEPAKVLREFERVLRPAGRVVVSVPNDWRDASGKDPNPHHLHVYTLDRLVKEVRSPLLLERLFAQTAGGGQKLPEKPRRIVEAEVPGASGESAALPQAEWWLSVAMKDPVGRSKAGFVETTYAPMDAPEQGLTAFARDYDNPWLVKGIVALGMRCSRPRLLEDLARRTIAAARPGSADHGAAVCVRLYRAMEGDVGGREVEGLLEEAARFDQSCDGTAHAWRWRISNHFARGVLLESLGRLQEAGEAFEACAGLDPLRFSPVLATKTVEACFRRGRLAMGAGAEGVAREWWRRGTREAERCVRSAWAQASGDRERPLPFAMPELARVLDNAVQCAAALGQDWQVRPGLSWLAAHQNQSWDNAVLRAEAARLSQAWERQRMFIANLERRAESAARASETDVGGVREEIDRLRADRDTWKSEAERLGESWRTLREAWERAAKEQSASAEDAARWRDEAGRLAEEWKGLRRSLEESLAAREALAAEGVRWRTEADRLAQGWAHLRKVLDAREAERGELLAEAARWRDEAARLAEAWNRLRGTLEHREADIARWRAEAERLTGEWSRVRTVLEQRDAERAALAAEAADWREEARRLSGVWEQLRGRYAALEGEMRALWTHAMNVQSRPGFRFIRALGLVPRMEPPAAEDEATRQQGASTSNGGAA